MANVKILGVRFDSVSMQEAISKIGEFLISDKPHLVVTPNPEICLRTSFDLSYRLILNSADMSVPDGFGIVWAGRYLQGRPGPVRWLWTLLTPWWNRRFSTLRDRVTGVDVMMEICARFADSRVFLLGASDPVNAACAEVLRKQYGTTVVGNISGSDSEEEEPEILEMIRSSGASVVFVAFGAPKQERWLYRNRHRLTGVRVMMGVGGAFDFISGQRRRAPFIFRRMGVEWLWRLALEPSRIVRIWRAVVVFPWRVLTFRESS